MTSDEHQRLPERAEALPTTLLCDITRDLGHPHQALSTRIQAVNRTVRRTAGWAYTVSGGPPAAGQSGPDHAKARAIDAMPAGAVAVWAGGAVEGVCLFGDLLALAMQVRGVRAAVVDGGVRDIEDLDAADFPVYARYRTPLASTGYWRVREVQEPVAIPAALGPPVTVRPGDLIVADANGVVCVPGEISSEVIERAEAHAARETEIRERLRAGDAVDDLLTRYGRI